MASQVTGRSFFHHKSEFKEEKKQCQGNSVRMQILGMAQKIVDDFKITETAPPPSLSDHQTSVNKSKPVSFVAKRVKGIQEDDIWDKDDPWFKELQKLQPLLREKFPERTASCTYATQDWTLSLDTGSNSD